MKTFSFFGGGGREGGLERPFLIFWGGSYETSCETRKYVLLIQHFSSNFGGK